VILVVRAGKTSQSALNQALERLARVNANLIGLVVTNVDNRSSRYGGYYYYQYYADGYANPEYFAEAGETDQSTASANGSSVQRLRKRLTQKSG
jgi:Mrp family chromosome partitioning ATPase